MNCIKLLGQSLMARHFDQQVADGALGHRDSMGQVAEIKPGDVQRLSAGTGVVHSEYNASRTDPVHFLQIWIMPDQQGLEPSYAHQH